MSDLVLRDAFQFIPANRLRQEKAGDDDLWRSNIWPRALAHDVHYIYWRRSRHGDEQNAALRQQMRRNTAGWAHHDQ